MVNEWDTFESNRTDATIEDFCRYYLAKKDNPENKQQLWGGQIPPESNSILGKMMGRLNAINAYYFKNSKKEGREIDLASFGLLNSIFFRKEVNKTEAINDNFMEFSTGVDVISRLKTKGLIEERKDPNDLRAKLVKLTPEGIEALKSCREDLGKIARFMYGDMNEDDKKTIIKLLGKVDERNSQIISDNKSNDLWALICAKSDDSQSK